VLFRSDCGDTKHELRALELLGKISDVGLFAEKTEINVNHYSGFVRTCDKG